VHSARIVSARSGDDLRAVAQLFAEYASTLPIDLGYQGFAAELASLPGAYAPPTGELLLALDPDPIGCVGLRPFASGVCEMKRLYVRSRGRGVGRALAETIVRAGRLLGYREMRLDTLDSMTPAIALYKQLGFVEIAAYYATPIANTVFMSLAL
jgi:GNAT superfamily N-acetyltransferase